ncbi:MAG: metallophosphoesterase family protein [Peptococcaceae bacterium]|nr:metallophosphoesterase family protein [Peptococcaceae bacterium]
MHVIGLVSDTHIPRRAKELPGVLLQGLQGVDLILHAGDLVDGTVLQTLGAIAPVVAVAGNMDPPDLRKQLGTVRLLTVNKCQIGLIHGDGTHGTTKSRALTAFPAADCIVFGHSHQPLVERHGSVLLVNPGSPTDRRLSPKFSYGLLYVNEGKAHAEIIYF